MKETPKEKGGSNMAEVVSLERRMLLTRHREGDSSAFPEFVALFRAPVFSYIVRCGVEPQSRDDLFQEIFVKVHLNAHQYQVERPVEPWLFTIVANSVRSHYRKCRVREIISEEASESLAERGPDSEAQVSAKETLAWLESNIAKLPFSQREVLNLCCFHDFSQKEAAQILEIPVNTVKTHLFRARAQLTRSLAKRNAIIRREGQV